MDINLSQAEIEKVEEDLLHHVTHRKRSHNIWLGVLVLIIAIVLLIIFGFKSINIRKRHLSL